jgi:hypothetical protein
MFAYMGAGWNVSAGYPKDWIDDLNILNCKKKIVDIINVQFQECDVWGVKDPRICRLLPLWNSIFEELGLNPKYVHIVRNPYEVAKSLTKRDACSVDYALMLWVRYILDAILYSPAKDCSYVTYEDLNTDWRSSISRVSEELNLPWPNSSDAMEVSTQIDDFVSGDLWHNRLKKADVVVSEWGDVAEMLYTELLALTRDNNDQEAKNNIDRIRDSADDKFQLFDEICFPMMDRGSKFYTYTIKFQNENKVLLGQKNKLLDRVNLLTKENIRLEIKIRNVLSFGFYGLKKSVVNYFKHD